MAIPTIEDFKSSISNGGGFANTNLYSIILPAGIAQGSYGTIERPQNLTLLAKTITLPARQLSSVERLVGMEKRDVAYGFINPTLNVTFRVLNDQRVRNYFESWQQSIIRNNDPSFSEEGNYSVAFPDEYTFDISVYQWKKGQSFPVFNRGKSVSLGPLNVDLEVNLDLEASGVRTYEWKFIDAFPITVQHETLNDDAKGEMSEINIEFSYRNWVGLPVGEKPSVSIEGGASISTNVGNAVSNKIYDILN
jgi:hypothetical protein